MQRLLALAKNKFSEHDYQCVVYALEFAEKAHEGQNRLSGELYITHPIETAIILLELGMDPSTVISAILHDVLEDTKVSEGELKQKFGEQILNLVIGVTKISKIRYTSEKEAQAENIRKLFFAMAQDIRVLLIKLADRLHNMRTLNFLSEEKQQRIALETLEIYAPLAGRLGISNIKSEMEDLCMKYLYPKEFEELANAIELKREERMGFVNKIASDIEAQLIELNIKGEVKGRPKHFYSIYKKMKNNDKTLDQIYDLIAVRVIVETVSDCYTMLGLIHSIWRPIPGRFKDYIAMPKPNMYQSLHTTVVTNFGTTFEIQIRTYEMNNIAEYGIAAHWMYKEGGKQDENYAGKLSWVKEMMEVQADLKDSVEFMETLKLDVLSNDIYVFSPKGDVFNLPKGSNCIDFAYAVHTAVGNKCVGAKINNKIVPLNTPLNNGDIVEILTQANSKGPSRDWLKIAKTASTKAKIRSFFKKAMQEENIKLGKEMMEKEAKHRGYALSDLLVPSWLKVVCERYSFSSLDDIYASIGYGGITTNQILLKLIDFYKKDQALKQPELIAESAQEADKKVAQHRHGSGILIEGFDDFLIRVSKCCNPVPGDEIIGYVSRGRGVSVHRKDCPNMKNVEGDRLIRAEWAKDADSAFVASIRIDAQNRSGMLNKITSVISADKLQITSINARANSKGSQDAIILLDIEIKELGQLFSLIAKLKSIEGVYDVYRDNKVH
ncbi:MAG: RelA/SpoT family protein [Christensenellales bacterium]|jgi:guanosine-3',5'-bis(diphosphate) 3'-pyrophosphohydrolase